MLHGKINIHAELGPSAPSCALLKTTWCLVINVTRCSSGFACWAQWQNFRVPDRLMFSKSALLFLPKSIIAITTRFFWLAFRAYKRFLQGQQCKAMTLSESLFALFVVRLDWGKAENEKVGSAKVRCVFVCRPASSCLSNHCEVIAFNVTRPPYICVRIWWVRFPTNASQLPEIRGLRDGNPSQTRKCLHWGLVIWNSYPPVITTLILLSIQSENL